MQNQDIFYFKQKGSQTTGGFVFFIPSGTGNHSAPHGLKSPVIAHNRALSWRKIYQNKYIFKCLLIAERQIRNNCKFLLLFSYIWWKFTWELETSKQQNTNKNKQTNKPTLSLITTVNTFVNKTVRQLCTATCRKQNVSTESI